MADEKCRKGLRSDRKGKEVEITEMTDELLPSSEAEKCN